LPKDTISWQPAAERRFILTTQELSLWLCNTFIFTWFVFMFKKVMYTWMHVWYIFREYPVIAQLMLSWFGQKTKYFDKLTYIIQLYYTARVWLYVLDTNLTVLAICYLCLNIITQLRSNWLPKDTISWQPAAERRFILTAQELSLWLCSIVYIYQV
jgi:hypothetical protein